MGYIFMEMWAEKSLFDIFSIAGNRISGQFINR